MNDTEKQHLDDRLSAIERRLAIIETTLWGQSGNNGINGSLKELKRKMDTLLRFFWVATATPAIIVSMLAVLKFLGKL